MGINLFYYNWHLFYPAEAEDIKIVKKDRRGELWYYLHQQILARFNAERLSNNLDRVKRLSNFQAPIIEGHFPKLNSQNTSQSWPPRFENTVLHDLSRPNDNLKLDLDTLKRWIDHIYSAIELGQIETV